jgi:hypothetical protein
MLPTAEVCAATCRAMEASNKADAATANSDLKKEGIFMT